MRIVHPLPVACALILTLAAASVMAADSRAGSCAGDDSGLTLPAGFCATVFADRVGHARHLVVSRDGVVYVNTWSGSYYGGDTPHAGGFLVALKDTMGTGKADVQKRFGETVATGGAGGTGIGIYKGGLYVETKDKIVRYSLHAGAIMPRGAPQTVVTSLPLGGDHPMHPFAIDADGLMYIDVASATNSCQLKNRSLKSPGANPCTELDTRGGIWRYDATKTAQVFSSKERFATGIRNAEGFAIDAAGHQILVTQHGRDQLHMNWPDVYKPEEEATLPAEELLDLTHGSDYGWPMCYYDARQQKLLLAPEYGGDGKIPGVCTTKSGPVAAFPAHWAPDGMVFYDKRQFPPRYRNGVFIAFHGSWNRAPYAQGGYNVVFQPLTGAKASGNCEIFAGGFAGRDVVTSPDQAAHRPTGVAAGPDGSLYISDDVGGRIYRIVYRGGAGSSAPAISCPSATAAAGSVANTGAGSPEGARMEPRSLRVSEVATQAMVARDERIYHGNIGGAACTDCRGADGSGTPLGPDHTARNWR